MVATPSCVRMTKPFFKTVPRFVNKRYHTDVPNGGAAPAIVALEHAVSLKRKVPGVLKP